MHQINRVSWQRPRGVVLVLMAVMMTMGLVSQAHAQPLVVVEDGRSTFQIYHAADAPNSVKLAARELQTYLAKATGATLAIVAEERVPGGAVISLGDTAAARAAGIDVAALPVEGYRLLTSAGNVFIVGPDTPDGGYTDRGGHSTGTLNGVYTFLEEQVGVRWPMPGPGGEEVPELRTLTLEPMDRVDAPGFDNRRLPYVQQNDREVRTWLRRHKQGYSLKLEHGHNWRKAVPPELYETHPDWFVMIGGFRVPPVGRYKLETTNPGLVQHYAQQAIRAFEENPNLYSFSLSPSDSRGWSESPESLALQETDPHGRLSVTPMILKFYNDVARIVRQARPDRMLAGYIYADYLYPPSSGTPRLEPNLYLVVAPHISYGYGLHRPTTRREVDELLGTWNQATDNLAYYDLPTRLSQSVGAPNAPGLEILAYLFPMLAKHNVQGVYIYGVEGWGHGALLNYVLAKLMWDPHADVQALAADFCRHAYGPEAGPIMAELYTRLDAATKAYYLANDEARYNLTPEMMEAVYVRELPHMEELYLRAQAAAQAPRHRARVDMFGQSLMLFRWHLTQRKLIEADASSPLYRTGEQIQAMLKDPANRLTFAPSSREGLSGVAVDAVKVRMAEAPLGNAQPVTPYLLRGPSRLMLYAQGDHEIVVRPVAVNARNETVQYAIHDGTGQKVAAGVLARNEPIRFAAQERQVYFLDITTRSASYRLEVEGCPFAIKTTGGRRGLHFLQKPPALYFFVPEGVDRFAVTMSSDYPGETAAATILSPRGRRTAKLDTSSRPADRQSIAVGDEPAGFWALVFEDPPSGRTDDVYLQFDDALPSWVSVDPEQAMIVTPIAAP